MKFIETMNGTYINMDEVAEVYHEEGRICVNSFIKLKNGEVYDFLDCPQHFKYEEVRTEFIVDHLITWHRHAIDYILNSPKSVIPIEILEEETWNMFYTDLIDLQKIIKCSDEIQCQLDERNQDYPEN